MKLRYFHVTANASLRLITTTTGYSSFGGKLVTWSGDSMGETAQCKGRIKGKKKKCTRPIALRLVFFLQ